MKHAASAAALAAAILVCGVGLVAYGSLRALLRANDWESHTQVVLVELEHEVRLIREAENARLAFALTRDESPAQSFERFADGARRTLDEIRQLTSDNPRQQKKLAELGPLVTQRLKKLSESIAEDRSVVPAAREQTVPRPQPGAEVEPIFLLLAEMNDEEARLLDERRARAVESATESERIVLLSTALAALTLAGAAAVIFRSTVSRREVETRLENKRALLDSVVEGMGDGLVSADTNGSFILFNPAAERLLGTGKIQGSMESWAVSYGLFRGDTTTPFPSEELPLARALRGERSDAVEIYVSRPQRAVWLNVTGRPLRDAKGAVTGGFAVFSDVTERHQAAAEIEAVNVRLRTTVADLSRLTSEKTMLAALADTLHGCLTLEEAYGAVARAASRLFPDTSGELFVVDPSHAHLSRAAVWGTRLESGADKMFEPDDCWAARRGHVHLALGSNGVACAHIAPSASDRNVCVPMMGQEGIVGILHLELDDSKGRDPEAAAVPDERVRTATNAASLITSALTSIRLRDKLRIQSIRDPLTGLFNRRYMEESLTRELRRAERVSGPVGIIMMDVDHFKLANDEHGHAAGDTVLRELGALLATHIRSSDLGCRYGGEEFTLILPDANLDETFARAETIRIAVEKAGTRLPNGSIVTTTVSQGVSSFPLHGSLPSHLLRAADAALYTAKRAGRNRVERAPIVTS